jgi:hypothetical protein
MKKIQLKLDTLQVESFPTAKAPEEKGTVDAHQIVTRFNNCTDTTCPPYNCFCTEDNSCFCQDQ